jgi:hypothetical protein
VTSLLRGSWCRRCLLTGVVIDLSVIKWLLTWLLTCAWDSNGKFLLSSNSSSSIGILALLALFIYLSILWWYVYRNDQDLAI